jgi:hypothetical protein
MRQGIGTIQEAARSGRGGVVAGVFRDLVSEAS